MIGDKCFLLNGYFETFVRSSYFKKFISVYKKKKKNLKNTPKDKCDRVYIMLKKYIRVTSLNIKAD